MIGQLRYDGLYVVYAEGKKIVSAKATDITQGILYDRPYQSKPQVNKEPAPFNLSNYNEILLGLLAHENIASRAAIFDCYDKQVQGRSVIEPGWADAGVMTPFNEDKYPEEIRTRRLPYQSIIIRVIIKLMPIGEQLMLFLSRFVMSLL